ncbi:beta-galactosidase [Bacteroides thetaiotaomicron]|nr:beta-galactosidase [Bacteroides thetaiotaomicron]
MKDYHEKEDHIFIDVCTVVVNLLSAEHFPVWDIRNTRRQNSSWWIARGLILDGKHIIPVMGEIHYSRVPESEWRREIRKMKAGGINIISTYIFWIHHEPEEGKWNWSGNHNLRRFVRICAEENVMLVLRLGPFCHGEVYQGGIPSWVHEKAGQNPKYKIRARTPGFLEDCTKLYNTIFAQVNGLLWKDGGPVVGVQIENESRGPWDYPGDIEKYCCESGI